MNEHDRALLLRLERERLEELRQRHDKRRERRRRALQRPEARAEWERLATEEADRDRSAGGTPALWADGLIEAVLADWETGDPPPDHDDLEAARDSLLRANAARPEVLVGLLAIDLKDVADRLWLRTHGLDDDDEPDAV